MEPVNFESYFELQTDEVRKLLERIDHHISEHYPDLHRKFSYGMPTFATKKNIIHFAAMKHHLGIYPGPAAIEYFQDDLKAYKTSKGAIQIPYTENVPFDLLDKLIRYNLETIQ